jgi:hypothetical protein
MIVDFGFLIGKRRKDQGEGMKRQCEEKEGIKRSGAAVLERGLSRFIGWG